MEECGKKRNQGFRVAVSGTCHSKSHLQPKPKWVVSPAIAWHIRLEFGIGLAEGGALPGEKVLMVQEVRSGRAERLQAHDRFCVARLVAPVAPAFRGEHNHPHPGAGRHGGDELLRKVAEEG